MRGKEQISVDMTKPTNCNHGNFRKSYVVRASMLDTKKYETLKSFIMTHYVEECEAALSRGQAVAKWGFRVGASGA